MNISIQRSTRLKFATLLATIGIVMFGMNGCSNDDAVTPSRPDNIRMSFISSTDTADGIDILVLDTVKVLLKDIKLNVAISNDSSNFKTGPYVLFLSLNSSVNPIGSGYIPVGTYDKIQFEVHKLSDNEPVPDPEFSEGTLKFSVVAKGTYNGVRFVYKSDKSAKQKLSFPSALVVTETETNVTLLIRPYLWFINSNNLYMDPTDVGNRVEIDNNIKDNIKANFKGFRDNNRDGVPD